MAIELATNPEKLASVKQKLAENRTIAPLFDTPKFTKHIEAAYMQMYERYTADLHPEHITIVQRSLPRFPLPTLTATLF